MSFAITDAFLAEYARVSPEGRLDVIGGHTSGWQTAANGEVLRLYAVLFTTAEPLSVNTFMLRSSVTLPDGKTIDGAEQMQSGHRFFVVEIGMSVWQHGSYMVRVNLGPAAVELPLEVTP